MEMPSSPSGPKILLVRHGETEGNSARRMQPPTEPLSTKGRQQAARLGEALSASEAAGYFRVASVLVSDLTRTRETVEFLLEALGVDAVRQVRTEPLLQERNFGELRGRGYDEVFAEFGNPMTRSFQPPGGETWDEFEKRVDCAWTVIRSACCGLKARAELGPGAAEPEEVLVVVTHGLFLTALSQRHLDASPQSLFAFGNTSVTTVRLLAEADARAHIEKLNDMSHLEAAPLNDPALEMPSCEDDT